MSIYAAHLDIKFGSQHVNKLAQAMTPNPTLPSPPSSPPPPQRQLLSYCHPLVARTRMVKRRASQMVEEIDVDAYDEETNNITSTMVGFAIIGYF